MWNASFKLSRGGVRRSHKELNSGLKTVNGTLNSANQRLLHYHHRALFFDILRVGAQFYDILGSPSSRECPYIDVGNDQICVS